MYSFEVIDIDKINIEEFNAFDKKSVFTTIEWLKFINLDQCAELIIIRITDEKKLMGYFTGCLVKKFGIKIFGSPLSGWATCYMGFDLFDYNLITALLKPTIDFIFKTTKCLYFECRERNLSIEDINKIKYNTKIVTTVEVDMDKTLDDILKSVKHDCRQYIRQFEKKGAVIEIVEPTDEFVEDLYNQICDVFLKQNLVPTFSLHKIRSLVESLKNTDKLLCLSVRDLEGKSIASYISVGYKDKFSGWCIGSLKEFQYYRPNEYLIWYAIKYWHERGMKVFDFAGEREYKLKWKPQKKEYLMIMASKYSILLRIRDLAKELYWLSFKVKGILKKSKLASN